MKNKYLVLTLGVALFVVSGSVVDAADWPQFRGADRTGISSEKGLKTTWPENGLAQTWKRDLGQGFSGLSVVDGTIYTMYAKGSDSFAAALSLENGETVWETRVGSTWEDRFGNGPRATPTVEGGHVYTLSGHGNLHALNAKDGSVVWSHDLKKKYKARVPQWGVSTQPHVEGKMLFVNVGGEEASIVAFDKKSGEEKWSALTDVPGYSAPVTMTLDDTDFILFFTAKGLVALDPQSGAEAWSYGWKTSYDVNAATPILLGKNRVFLSSGYDVGAAVVEISKGESGYKAEEIWKNREMKNQFSSSVLFKGYLYGFDDKTLKCVDAKTGETQWRGERKFGHGSLLLADGHLIVLGDKGQLALVEAKSDAYSLKAEQQVFEGKTWTVPTLVDGILLVRDESQLVALNAKAK